MPGRDILGSPAIASDDLALLRFGSVLYWFDSD